MKILSLLILISGFLIAAEPEAVKKPWRFKTTLGINLGQTVNQAFIGATNGVGFNPGFQFEEVIRLYSLPHEWRSELTLTESWALSSPQTAFQKTTDSLNLKSSYLYHWLDWFGPYGSAKLRTSLFDGYDLEASPYTYRITDAATGLQHPETPSSPNGTFIFPLTKAFLPLILEQDVGVFVQPYREDDLLLEFRTGVTARENIAKGQRVLTAVGVVYNNTPVRQLDNVYELGPSIGTHFKGDLFEKKLSYRLSCDALWSFLQVPITSVDSAKQFSFDLSAGVGFNLLPWLALNWQFKSIFNPAILDRVQIMSHLMLAVKFDH